MSSRFFSGKLIVSFIKLTRAWNLIIIALSQYFTAAMLIGTYTLSDWRLLLLVTSTVAIAAGGYIINDYYDIKIDLVNKPDRVIIGKNITRRYALLYHTLLSVSGVIIGAFLNWRIGAINFAAAFLLWWYSNDLKRQPFIGNFVVALLTAIAVMMVDGLYTTGSQTLAAEKHFLIISYAVFAFFMTLIREIIKDMEDLKGDDTFGCKTLPIVWGIRRTKLFIYLILAVFVIVVLLLNLFFTKLPFYYFLAFLFPPLLGLLYRLINADTKKDYAWLSSFCKLIMLLGIISLAFIR
jgi:4-hydroxybenzoate polyprenyltransferase